MTDYRKLQDDLDSQNEANSNLLKWELGTTLLGEVLSIVEEESPDYGDSMKLTVKAYPDDRIIEAFCPTILRSRIRAQKVMAGMIVKIKCVSVTGGKKENTKMFYFEAFWDEDDTTTDDADD